MLGLVHHDRPARLTARADFLFRDVPMSDYVKPWLSINDQINKLSSLGLIIVDRAAAENLLGTICFHCLEGYGALLAPNIMNSH